MKKFLSVLLAAALMLSCMSGLVLAADETATDTAAADETAASAVPEKVASAVCLMLDIPNALVNGEKKILDVVPFTVNDRTMVPFRFIGEAFGADVQYVPGEVEKVVLTLGSKTIELTIGSDKMIVDGSEQTIDAPAIIKDDRTFVPLRASAQAFGKEVFWDDATRLIIISDTKDIYNSKADQDAIYEVIESMVTIGLADLKVDGVTVPGFDPNVFEYTVKLPMGTTKVPTVEAIPATGCTLQMSEIKSLPINADIKVGIPWISDLFNRYRLTVREAKEIEITASGHDGNVPENVMDGNLTTRWAMDGEAWIQFDFMEPKEISAVSIAFWKSDKRKAKLTILVSEDGINYEEVFDGKSTLNVDELEDFPLPETMKLKSVKILGHGNDAEDPNSGVWNSYLEIEFK